MTLPTHKTFGDRLVDLRNDYEEDYGVPMPEEGMEKLMQFMKHYHCRQPFIGAESTGAIIANWALVHRGVFSIRFSERETVEWAHTVYLSISDEKTSFGTCLLEDIPSIFALYSG